MFIETNVYTLHGSSVRSAMGVAPTGAKKILVYSVSINMSLLRSEECKLSIFNWRDVPLKVVSAMDRFSFAAIWSTRSSR